jgi:[acyl-carrier-protein] S-malonyltransferase
VSILARKTLEFGGGEGMGQAFVFPGQGSQKVGMGKEIAVAFPIARELFEEVDEVLKQNLSRLMFEGPEDELTLTENAQPALMAVSLAVLGVLRDEGGFDLANSLLCVAGHSLGEYSALAAAGTFSTAETARLLKTRGRAMQQAVPVGEGAMAAVMGLDVDDVRAAAEEAGAACANDNAPGQVVVSGSREAVERAVEAAAGLGAKRSIMLPVSAPFHSPLMAPAAEVMFDALAEASMVPPVVPLIANITAAPVKDCSRIRSLLVEQVTGLVRWRESVLAMKDLGVNSMAEIGVGKVLTGLARRIDRDIDAMSVEGPDDIEAFLKANG